MDFSLTEEQQLLQQSIDKFVAGDYDFERRRALINSGRGYSEAHWQQFADLGWLGVAFSEADGGYGGTATDLMVVMQAFGKGLVIEPYLASVVLGGGLIAALGSQAQRDSYLQPLMEGKLQLALAFAEQRGRFDSALIETQATPVQNGYEISGKKIVVLNGPNADHFLVTAYTNGAGPESDGVSVLMVAADAEGISRCDYSTVDGFRAAEMVFDRVQVPASQMLGEPGAALPALEATLDRARVAVCAEALGIMDTLLQKTLEYCQTRKQFGVPIASFQVLQHRMADMFIECELARSMLYRAAMQLDGMPSDEASLAVSAAKSRIGSAARIVGQQAVQLHGGMGVTDELDVGHYFKRLTVIETLFGNSNYHLSRYMEAI